MFRGPQDGDRVGNPVGGQVVFKLRGAESGGRLTAFETIVAPGEGPPMHVHADDDETLYVLEGEVRFSVAGELGVGGPGTFVHVARGTEHTFQNVGDGQARMLIHFTPSGMERFFERFAAEEAPGPETFARVGAEVGMRVVGPPLGSS